MAKPFGLQPKRVLTALSGCNPANLRLANSWQIVFGEIFPEGEKVSLSRVFTGNLLVGPGVELENPPTLALS